MSDNQEQLSLDFYESLYVNQIVNDQLNVTVVIGRPKDQWRFWLILHVNDAINLLELLDHARRLLMRDQSFAPPNWIHSEVKQVRLLSRDADEMSVRLSDRLSALKAEMKKRDDPVLQFTLDSNKTQMYALGSLVHVQTRSASISSFYEIV